MEAYVRGFQGKELGPSSVATMTKHFPGGGPQKDGEDPHFSYGREQVYPGGQFELHLKPFEVAIAAGTSQIMPYYGMPVGTEYEEVGFGFNKSIITGLLRERYGFNGIVCTDWGLLTDAEVEGEPFPARAWGVEHLSPKERMKKALDAGIDQFGGEACPELLVELVKSGDVSEERLDASARRLLKEKFLLGLFDNRMVDEKIAISVVGCQAFREAGLTAQRASITLLKNDVQADGRPVLPFSRGAKLYVEGINEKVASHYGHVVSSPDEADIAILRVQAPFEKRATKFENYFHAGSLDMDAELVGRIRDISRKVPTVVDIFLDRPAILSSIVDEVGGLVANFGAHPTALLDVLVGDFAPTGTLPFDIPASMAAVQKSRPDVPFDTKDATFRFGHGLNYGV
ncbi:Beta-glucosidase BoGH3B [compost metagenome]